MVIHPCRVDEQRCPAAGQPGSENIFRGKLSRIISRWVGAAKRKGVGCNMREKRGVSVAWIWLEGSPGIVKL